MLSMNMNSSVYYSSIFGQKNRMCLRFFYFFVCLCAALFFAQPLVWADNESLCQSYVDGTHADKAQKGLEAYAELPEFRLELSDVYKSISDLIKDAGKLSTDYQQLKNLESANPLSEKDLGELRSKIDFLKGKIQSDAVEAINQLDPKLHTDRKILEGHKILNDRISALHDKYNPPQPPPSDDDPNSNESQDKNDNPSSEGSPNSNEGQDKNDNPSSNGSPNSNEGQDKNDNPSSNGSPNSNEGQDKNDNQSSNDSPNNNESQDKNDNQSSEGSPNSNDTNKNFDNQAGTEHLGQELRDALWKILKKKAKISNDENPLFDDDRLKDKNFSNPNLESLTHKQATSTDDKTTKKPNLDTLKTNQTPQFIKLFIELAWKETVGNYSNSTQYKKSLTEFMTLSNDLFVKYPAISLLQQYAKKSVEYMEELSVFEIAYNDLKDLGLSAIKTHPQQDVHFLRKIKYIDRIFTELESVRNLEISEQRLLDLVRKTIGLVDLDSKPSDKELGEAFYNLMHGPLSQKTLTRRFSPKDPKEPLDWRPLAESIRSGKMNDLVLFRRMAPFVDILVNEIHKPHYQLKPIGDYEPINEYDSVIDKARELEELPNVIKEGFPSDMEILRMLAGDMLKNAYQEPIEVSSPKKPLSNKVTIVIFDISGSMEENRKWILRDAIIASFVDKSQLEVIRQEGTHKLYMIPFDQNPHEAERIGDIGQAQDYFERMRSQPYGYGGGTSITNALATAFEMIADHQKNGGELERGNILLITDGEDTIDFKDLRDARDKIDPEVDVALNAVTIGSWNEDLSKMVEGHSLYSSGDIGKVSHQHIPYEGLEVYLNVQIYVKYLQKVASAFNETKSNSLPSRYFLSFKNALIRVKTENDRKEQASSTTTKHLINKLLSSDVYNTKTGIKSALRLFYKFTTGTVSDSWPQNVKAKIFIQFVEILADAYGTDSKLIFYSIGAGDRTRIIQWIKE